MDVETNKSLESQSDQEPLPVWRAYWMMAVIVAARILTVSLTVSLRVFDWTIARLLERLLVRLEPTAASQFATRTRWEVAAIDPRNQGEFTRRAIARAERLDRLADAQEKPE